MRQKHRVAAIGLAVGVCLATPSWPETGPSRSVAHNVPRSLGCDSPDTDRRKIAVETVPAGIWQGFTLFRVSCGEITGQLFFDKHGNSLRYVVTHADENSDVSAISPSIRSRILQLLLERSFEVEGRRARYSFATSAFPEIDARLAGACAESSRWNRKAGRPRDTSTDRFARQLMNEHQTAPELAEVFGTLGYDLRVSGTEDLLVLPIARMTAAERRFVKVRLLPTDKLLVSAAVYFIVQRR
jgi:hypothetical protein